ncbi:uncharacterized protein LOC131153106 [Malania oleifera]|uniref:uncharacterized protein LOC131153106 n=1 Tax=Malania oleifera TaxID=397392 RepID=UPI0025ADFF0E|nr:uncharacterized protein LOC131153106 [Malania oleifera]
MVGQWIEHVDLWMNKAQCLKLRLRDHFRVAVDRHCRRPGLSDGYFSSTMQRWLHHFRDFRRESLPSSSVFYRKRVSKDIAAEEDPVIVRMLQSLAVPVIGNVCHVFMHGLNCVQVYGAEKLHQALLHRPDRKPLITVSNHVASMDDPLVIASLLPRSVLFDAHILRWTLCATDRCFTNPVTSAFFRCGKVLPISRGEGVYQKGLDMAVSKLNTGGWVHIFPEGTRSRDGGKTVGSAKRGVGRLILDADNIPIVVPFVHTGMQEIMPIGAKVPRIGKTVTVLIGDPINFDDLLNLEGSEHVSRGKLYDAISSRIGQRLHELKVQVDKLAIKQLQLQNYPLQSTERAAGMLQQVDWESFGMKSYIFPEDDSNSSELKIHTQPELNLAPSLEPTSERCFRMGSSYEGGIMSRIRGYIYPTELMGFAARGLFINRQREDHPASLSRIEPLKAWKQFLETNVLQQWSSC